MRHSVDMALECGHILIEPVEGALDIFLPKTGEARHCPWHNKETKIANVGTPFWVEEDQPQTEKAKVKK